MWPFPSKTKPQSSIKKFDIFSCSGWIPKTKLNKANIVCASFNINSELTNPFNFGLGICYNDEQNRIKEIIEGGESLEIEFKTSHFELNKDAFESVCAFLNRKAAIN